MTSDLSMVVVEIVQLVAGHLEKKDLVSLRLVCKALNEKTLDIFGRKYLGTIQTDLSRDDLHRLNFLAINEQLASHVQTLRIDSEDCEFGKNLGWLRDDGRCLKYPQPGTQIWRDLLSNVFRNCRSFRTCSRISGEEPYSDTVFGPTDALGMILNIIADASLAVKAFHVDFRTHGTGIIDESRIHIPQSPEFTEIWSHLQELRLQHSLTEENFDTSLELVTGAIETIRKLSLKLNYDLTGTYMKRILSEKAVHGLEELRLASLYVDGATLWRLLSRSETNLRSLHLQYVCLIGYKGGWKSFFTQLKVAAPLLEEVSAFWLKEQDTETSTNPGPLIFSASASHFCASDGEWVVHRKHYCGKKRNVGAGYHGRDMSTALSFLATSMEPLSYECV